MQVSYLRPFYYLLMTDLFVFKKNIWDKAINLVIWTAISCVVTAYIMPFFGLSKSYGAFYLAGQCASAGLFEAFPTVAQLVGDINGDQIIFYRLTLPLPSWMVLLSKMLSNAVSAACLSILVIPLGKLLLGNLFDLSQMNIPLVCLVVVLASLFFGAYVIFAVSQINDMSKIGNFWIRYVFPMWFLGGFQFSWQSLYSVSPAMAYLSLLNPMIYIMEGIRAALFGPEGYLNIWFCIGMLILFCITTAWAGIVLLKRQLDVL